MPVIHFEPGRRRAHQAHRASTALALALALAASPAAGDWLVTRDGAQVETRGPWKVKGKQVVFSDPDGDLVSLRLADVDLEASERVTREAVEAAEAREREPAPAPVRRKSVRVVTDADVGHVDPAADEAEKAKDEKPEDEKAKAAEKPVKGNSVVVSTWQRRELPGKAGVEIVGELSNNGQEIATDLQVNVALYDEDKSVLSTSAAIFDANSLRPGESVKFRAPFVGIYSFAEAGFDVQSWGLTLKARPRGEERAAPPADTPP